MKSCPIKLWPDRFSEDGWPLDEDGNRLEVPKYVSMASIFSTDTFEVQAAYSFDLNNLELLDNILDSIAGRKSSYGGCGASWAGGRSFNCGPYRDAGWDGLSFDEAVEMWNELRDTRKTYTYFKDLQVRMRPDHRTCMRLGL